MNLPLRVIAWSAIGLLVFGLILSFFRVDAKIYFLVAGFVVYGFTIIPSALIHNLNKQLPTWYKTIHVIGNISAFSFLALIVLSVYLPFLPALIAGFLTLSYFMIVVNSEREPGMSQFRLSYIFTYFLVAVLEFLNI